MKAIISGLLLAALLGLAVREMHARAVPTSTRAARAEREASARLAPVLKAQALELGAPALIRVFKKERVLELWLRANASRFALLKAYPICAFSGDLGPKLARGDGQSPEGFYAVRPGALNPNSSFHLSFDLGYPNAYDRAQGRTGSALMVHGACVSIGCYAMTDPAIEEVWTSIAAALRNGQREIQAQLFPFKMTAEALERRRGNRWYDFWADLKKGYDLFEVTKVPPRVEVREGRYRFTPAPTSARHSTVEEGRAAAGERGSTFARTISSGTDDTSHERRGLAGGPRYLRRGSGHRPGEFRDAGAHLGVVIGDVIVASYDS